MLECMRDLHTDKSTCRFSDNSFACIRTNLDGNFRLSFHLLLDMTHFFKHVSIRVSNTSNERLNNSRAKLMIVQKHFND